jgi:catechol 2,3-dioxygenase-like lactoylglutathione lyase family enzyme
VSDHSATERPKVSGINHVTFDAASVEESLEFYRDVLGCELVAHWRAGAYLTAGKTWIALVRRGEPPSPATDYSHIAFGVSREQFTGLTDRIRASGARVWQENWTEGDSLYFEDPTGHRLEIHCSDLVSRLRAARTEPWEGLVIVDEL